MAWVYITIKKKKKKTNKKDDKLVRNEKTHKLLKKAGGMHIHVFDCRPSRCTLARMDRSPWQENISRARPYHKLLWMDKSIQVVLFKTHRRFRKWRTSSKLAYKLIVDQSARLKMAHQLMIHFVCWPPNPYELVRHLRNRQSAGVQLVKDKGSAWTWLPSLKQCGNVWAICQTTV